MVSLEDFLVHGRFGPIGLDATSDEIVRAFGEAEDVEPQRGASPMMLLYGDVEFRLYDDRLSTLSVPIPEGEQVPAGTIATTGLWPADRRSMASIRDLLQSNGVGWRVDPVMSKLHDDENSQVWITEKQVHVAFFEGTLDRVAISDLVTGAP